MATEILVPQLGNEVTEAEVTEWAANVGDSVSEGQTIMIVEAMKTMNQIPSPRAGVVAAILVENAQPVEYGEPLIIIE